MKVTWEGNFGGCCWLTNAFHFCDSVCVFGSHQGILYAVGTVGNSITKFLGSCFLIFWNYQLVLLGFKSLHYAFWDSHFFEIPKASKWLFYWRNTCKTQKASPILKGACKRNHKGNRGLGLNLLEFPYPKLWKDVSILSTPC